MRSGCSSRARFGGATWLPTHRTNLSREVREKQSYSKKPLCRRLRRSGGRDAPSDSLRAEVSSTPCLLAGPPWCCTLTCKSLNYLSKAQLSAEGESAHSEFLLRTLQTPVPSCALNRRVCLSGRKGQEAEVRVGGTLAAFAFLGSGVFFSFLLGLVRTNRLCNDRLSKPTRRRREGASLCGGGQLPWRSRTWTGLKVC